MNDKDLQQKVKETYGNIAREGGSCCGTSASCSCSSDSSLSLQIGYSEKELQKIPRNADLGLGCGNPGAFASLTDGEIVLDLGSGAGIDCFIAAEKVGKTGKVIGVDMTPEMVEKAQRNAEKSVYSNIEFKLGSIENLPVEDDSIDVVISNCVINLVPDKQRVFEEIYRVLKPGGRFVVSDIVLTQDLPESISQSVEHYVACIAGAELKNRYITYIEKAGFIDIICNDGFPYTNVFHEGEKIRSTCCCATDDHIDLNDVVMSINVSARKSLV
jgi:arsenite methyltransferase